MNSCCGVEQLVWLFYDVITELRNYKSGRTEACNSQRFGILECCGIIQSFGLSEVWYISQRFRVSVRCLWYQSEVLDISQRY